MGYIVMVILNWILRKTKPAKVTKIFSKASNSFGNLHGIHTHGGNDTQKSMGIISMALLSGGVITTFHVPIWVKVACALAMAVGT